MGGDAVFTAAAYFSMAIEAQLNSDSPFQQKISGYALGGMTLSVALVVPNDNEGVETLLSMRHSCNKRIGASRGRHIKGVVQLDRFVQFLFPGSCKKHEHEKIGINKRNRDKIGKRRPHRSVQRHKLTLSQCRAPVTPPEIPPHDTLRLWIERLQDFAFDHGKTFQNIFDAHMDNATYAATTDMVVKQEFYICRLTPDRAISEMFVPETSKSRLSSIQEGVALKELLESGKIYFQNDPRVGQSLPSDSFEIDVKAVGINEQDSSVGSGSNDSIAFSHEIMVGDRVVAFSFDSLSTKQRTKAHFAQWITDEPFNIMATILTAFCPALYGLYEPDSVEKGDVFAILDGCGPSGFAAFQLCKRAQAKAIIINSIQSTASLFIDLGLPHDQIINPGLGDIAAQIQRLTGGRGPDIIFASQSPNANILMECSRVLTSFGRIVTFGK
ncbi:hypothetical protein NHQ30_007501 [Ciborinia camelliae]|nr:hypothetical protein NHQ30_007501 [Ciborinia camelliae]